MHEATDATKSCPSMAGGMGSRPGIGGMTAVSGEWVPVVSHENLPGSSRPAAALAPWLRGRGIDGMPFAEVDIPVDLVCGPKPDGHWYGWYAVKVRADALRRGRLHPDQARHQH
jgi:hypothetical protein